MKKVFQSSKAIIVMATIFAMGIGSNAWAQVPGYDPNQPQGNPPQMPPQQMQQQPYAQDQQPVTYQNFYDDLAPYGTWIDYPSYGHVWHPMIEGDFRPYLTNGNWNYSNEGWAWNSNYNWGWATFHYGRWMYDNSYGWLWIPGYEWSPAWVTWGNVDNYYAWAPIMPEVNVGLQFGMWRPHSFYWNVVGRDHILDIDIYNRVLDRDRMHGFANRITIMNSFSNTRVHNQFYARGPEIHDVERFTNRRIEPMQMREVNDRGQIRNEGNNMNVYRPAISHPQPREFRRVDNPQPNPVRNVQDRVAPTQRVQQQANVNRLPVRNAPPSAYGNQQNNRGGNDRHKN